MRPLHSFCPWLVALALLAGAPGVCPAVSAKTASVPAAACSGLAGPEPRPGPAALLAHWSDLILNNRARMIQVAFVAIALGIFILKR